MLLRVCVACVDGFGVGARCGWQEKPGNIQTIPMAGFFAGHVKTWYYSANQPDEDLNSTTEPADGTVTTSMKYKPTRTVDLVEAGRAAVAAGLPAVAFLSADDVARVLGEFDCEAMTTFTTSN